MPALSSGPSPSRWPPSRWLPSCPFAWPDRWRLPAAFDAAGYRAAHADLAHLGALRARWHFLRHGRAEGRLPCALRAAAAEGRLWSGDGAARGVLEDLAEIAGLGPEALWARLALARADLAECDPGGRDPGARDPGGRGLGGAGARLAGLAPALARSFGLPGPLFVVAETALHHARPAEAEAALALARGLARASARALARGLDGGSDAAAEALLRGAMALAAGDAPGWTAALVPLYAAAHLAPPHLAPPHLAGRGATPFDRLTAAPLSVPSGLPVPAGPLVSVILPARNAAATIGTALCSLTAQSWRDFEVLVVDDGSADGTAAEVAAHAARDGRIRLLPAPAGQRLGAYGARNLGLAAAEGEFIALQDADDWSHPDRLARQVQALLATPAQPACLSHWARLDEGLIPACWRPDVPVVHENLSSLMIRRTAVQRLGVWDRVRAGADSEYIARLVRVFGAGAVLPVLPGVPLAFGRQRAGSLSRGGATGLLGPGAAARAAYLAAARAWHARSPAPRMDDGGPHPFPVPPALRMPDEEGP